MKLSYFFKRHFFHFCKKERNALQRKKKLVPRMIHSMNQHAAARVLARRVANSFETIIQHDLINDRREKF